MKITLIGSTLLLGLATTAYSADLDWNGKFRYRHERTHLENNAGRTRRRLQAKLGVKTKVNDHVTIKIGLASGGSSATSTNQTLGDGKEDSNTSKSINLDYAQFKFIFPMTGLNIAGGKVKNPFYRPGKTQIIWDRDVNQEGLYASHTKKFGAFGYDIMVANMFINESSGAREDDTLLAAQVAFIFDIDNMNFRLGGSRYNYETLKGQSSMSTKGNSSTGTTFDHNYRLQEIYFVAGMKLMDMPVSLYVDMISNEAAIKNNEAKTYGLNVGNISKKGSFKVSYNYREIEEDAVVAANPVGGQGTDWRSYYQCK